MRRGRIWVEEESSAHLGFVEDTPSYVSEKDFVPPRGLLSPRLPPVPSLALMAVGWWTRGADRILIRVSNLRQDRAMARARARACFPRATKNSSSQF